MIYNLQYRTNSQQTFQNVKDLITESNEAYPYRCLIIMKCYNLEPHFNFETQSTIS